MEPMTEDIPANIPPDLMTPEEYSQAGLDAVPTEPAFGDNLAESMSDTDLAYIGQKIVERFEWDERSRTDWQERERKGILMMGVSEKTEGGANFEGSCKVVHPMLAEACIQFQARAIAEMWPADGPVKTQLLGYPTDEGQAQAKRVEGFLNYQYTVLMPEAFEELDKLLFRLPLSGSCFKKVYPNPVTGEMSADFIEPAYFVVPYTATNLANAPRYTHVILVNANDLKKQQVNGFYRKIELVNPNETAQIDNIVKDAIDSSEGRVRTDFLDDQRHTLLEVHCDYDIPGHEDENGVALPYIITVDKDSHLVLGIRRNWREEDPKKKKRVWFVHYKFLPGLGFYGYGFLHVMGGLSRAATGALRALLDAAAFANLQGGFVSKDCKLKRENKSIAPGEWVETDSSMEDLQKSFMKLPYDEPSRTLFMLLGSLDELGRRIAGTTESMTGEGSNTGAVGTTVALIEQGLKVFSGIHKRLHEAAGREYQLIAQLDKEFMQQEEYPYNVPGEARQLFKADFDERVDVLPVSDPNIVSQTQRISQAQAVLQLSQQAGGLYNQREVHKKILTSLRIDNIETLLPEQNIPRLDPVSEGMAMMTTKPVQAYPDQEHQAHIMVHQALMMTLPQDIPQQVAPSIQAHIAEHYAFIYHQEMTQKIGQDIPAQEVDPKLEGQYSRAEAMAIGQSQDNGMAQAMSEVPGQNVNPINQA